MEGSTVKVSTIPLSALAEELLQFLESHIGPRSIFACTIVTERRNWKSKGFGRVQFETCNDAKKANDLSLEGKLVFQGNHLSLTLGCEDIVPRPCRVENRVNGGFLKVGCLVYEDSMSVIGSWNLVKAELMPERKRVDFYVSERGELFKLETRFEDIVETFGCQIGGTNFDAILLQIKYAPRIYCKVPSSSKCGRDRYHICKEEYEFDWVRTTDFSASRTIGQSTYFCWMLHESTDIAIIKKSFPHHKEIQTLYLDKGVSFCSSSDLVPIINTLPDCKLAYEILFQLNALVHAGKISGPTIGQDLLDILAGNENVAKLALAKLHKSEATCYDPLQIIQRHINDITRNKKKLQSPSSSKLEDHNLMNCHRALVTPSKVYFLGPELETSNYIVKHFAAYADDFLRVSFVDEDWSKLPSDALSPKLESGFFAKPYRTNIYKRIVSVLRDGIVLGSKRFEFLAFSASQLRSNAVWMFASNENISVESIREWMGEFKNLRCIAKCAARMGQLFSSSTPTLSVPLHEVQVIPDIEVTTDGIEYCFSDGIGKISLAFARQVARRCGLKQPPSAFQIRYGGYKGVIAIDPTSFHKLALRPSMQKFNSNNTMLCVTKWSQSMPCYLNREIITLLSTLEIADHKFEAMQKQQMTLLDDMLTKRDVALNVLEDMIVGDYKEVLTKMLLHGCDPSTEPYLSMMLQALRDHQLSDIRSKCRLFVSKGRVLLGCLDESGTLSQGEVFLRVTMTKAELENDGQPFFERIDETTSVVVGAVVVTKNPCLHPGDVRVLQAVSGLELVDQGMVDCLVFPQNGERPHPNECSGGDLDGDLFFVCWDKDLIPTTNDPAMDYLGRRPRIMDHEVTMEEIQEFFVDYMINDNLGAISNAHLVLADREKSKARSPKCIELAKLHSMAVDFAKTGAPAEMPRSLMLKEYPDFMERGEKSTYASPGILGKLYRLAKEASNSQSFELVSSKNVALPFYDTNLLAKGFEEFIELAVKHKEAYGQKLQELMDYYGAESESEILSGNISKKSGYLQRDNRKYGEVKDRILIAVKNLQREAQGWFKSSCEPNQSSKLASAWYHVTYRPDHFSKVNFFSFPWILADVLLNIKAFKSQMR
ncbi:hypothetical protein AMTRI_Chr10g230970 [Amborella trichopoda]|uniref:RNA-dependent RNA polymerase n=1 Tax=Amborella trichopoda TaxID=13333 RepID=W1NRA4_AMBTC|nr:RNA-dependent RNA polymerase 2 [Amborella trichopoda]ERM99496.1 hypothetical protein AMTR_s00088p00026960 [Amborella trichopoda]|eukprot:XP_006836643.1 RNA-dependent RNA polymerase 2 [Amborella trichopoda]